MNGQGTKAGAAKSPWIEHVKSYMVTHNCSYKQALSGASESYQKVARQVRPKGSTIRAISPPPKERKMRIRPMPKRMAGMVVRPVTPPPRRKPAYMKKSAQYTTGVSGTDL